MARVIPPTVLIIDDDAALCRATAVTSDESIFLPSESQWSHQLPSR